MRRCVWSRNLKNGEAMDRVEPQRHRKKHIRLIDCNIDAHAFTVPLTAAVSRFPFSKHRNVPQVHPTSYFKHTGCSDCSLLLTVCQHPVLRLIMNNDRCPLILHVILTCRRKLHNFILLFVRKWKHRSEHCSWV